MSRAADALRLSGFAGLALGAAFGNYQVMLRSPALLGGSQAAPSWMVATHVHLLGLSLIVLFYSLFIDDLFEGYVSLTAGMAILAQWIEPLAIYPLEVLGIGVFGLLILIAAIANLAVLLTFVVNYLRRGWGTAGHSSG